MGESLRARWRELGVADWPVVLAPLAGVSDHPFRRACAQQGADLTYVEMLSATAIAYRNKKTLEMLARHADEGILGVQVTGRQAEETADAVAFLDAQGFETIDINMGCPVRKVVQSGCGSGFLRDPERVFATIRACRQATPKPLSVKVRLGWDRESLNISEIARLASEAGADWLTVHGRTRSEDYGVPVDLGGIHLAKTVATIPVLGNGNVFEASDAEAMRARAGVDGVMVSRGALGDPWVFRRIKGDRQPLHLDEWEQVVVQHVAWQQEAYADSARGVVCMRKHLLWYLRGWPMAKDIKEAIVHTESLQRCLEMIREFCEELRRAGHTLRASLHGVESEGRFLWDPKYEMDRSLDRGVGHLDGPELSL